MTIERFGETEIIAVEQGFDDVGRFDLHYNEASPHHVKQKQASHDLRRQLLHNEFLQYVTAVLDATNINPAACR